MKNQKIETTNWLTKGISQEQLKTEKALAVIAAKIYTKRTQLGMDQKAFAKHMGVTQGLISRWESGTYNFSISTLISICEKLELAFDPHIFEKDAVPQNVIFVNTKNPNTCPFECFDWTPSKKDLLGKGVA